jgi:hypothetical protein
MSDELKKLIEVGLKFGLDVSNLTEEQAQSITLMSEELSMNMIQLNKGI